MERLQKIIAARGLCSRRQAEAWILEGRVLVNGVPCGRQYTLNPDFNAGGAAFFDGNAGERPAEKEHRVFINAVQGKGELCVLPEQAACVTRILEAIYTSAKTGQPVYFD